MTVYNLMLKTNEYLIKGGALSDKQKQTIIKHFLDAVSTEDKVIRFHSSVRAPSAENGDTRHMYPVFFIPPYNNGKKYKTVTTVTPHTHILSANAYELEIIRLLYLLAPNNKMVIYMLNKTLERLKTTCFGNFCDKGECFETSVIVLRFLSATVMFETAWIDRLINGIKVHINDKKRHSGILFYYWLSLSELPSELALPEITRFKDDMLISIKRSYVMNSSHDRYFSPLCKYIVRNCLSRLNEFEHIKDREPFVSEKDGRLHFDINIH